VDGASSSHTFFKIIYLIFLSKHDSARAIFTRFERRLRQGRNDEILFFQCVLSHVAIACYGRRNSALFLRLAGVSTIIYMC